MKAKRERKCKICDKKFIPFVSLQKWCSPDCGVKIAEQIMAKNARKQARIDARAVKADRVKDRVKRESLKTRREWLKDAQVALNRWVRLVRDRDFPCISCGRFHDGQWHGGHYLSRGAHPELALDELNVWKQCQPCNTHLSGNQLNFRKGLIERIGIEKVEWLEGKHEPKKYSIDELKLIAKEYRLRYSIYLKGS